MLQDYSPNNFAHFELETFDFCFMKIRVFYLQNFNGTFQSSKIIIKNCWQG